MTEMCWVVGIIACIGLFLVIMDYRDHRNHAKNKKAEEAKEKEHNSTFFKDNTKE